MEGDRRDLQRHVQQLGIARACTGGAVQCALGLPGQIDAEILDAVLVAEGVCDLCGMDTDGLPDVVQVDGALRLCGFCHGKNHL